MNWIERCNTFSNTLRYNFSCCHRGYIDFFIYPAIGCIPISKCTPFQFKLPDLRAPSRRVGATPPATLERRVGGARPPSTDHFLLQHSIYTASPFSLGCSHKLWYPATGATVQMTCQQHSCCGSASHFTWFLPLFKLRSGEPQNLAFLMGMHPLTIYSAVRRRV
jgi:hypothetical protein